MFTSDEGEVLMLAARWSAVVGGALVALAVLAMPAGAHEEIHPNVITVNTPTFFTLNAANEAKVDLVKIVVTAPDGVPVDGSVRPPAGWTAESSESKVTFTGGAVKPGQYDQWGFETDGVAQPASVEFTVTLGFADGKTEDVKVPLTVTTSGSAAAPTTAVSVTPTSAAASTSSSKSSNNGTATAALIVAIIGVLIAVGAAVVALRGRRSAPPTAASGPSASSSW